MEKIINNKSINELMNIYFQGSGQYEEATPFSTFMTLCNQISHTKGPKYQCEWRYLGDKEKDKLKELCNKINIHIKEKYYNIDEIFSDIRLADITKLKDSDLTIDMNLLNIINKFYHVKFGVDSRCMNEYEDVKRKDLNYLNKKGIYNFSHIQRAFKTFAFDSDRMYFLYNSRLLPIFTPNNKIKYSDILDNTWPFIKNNLRIKRIEFVGWKKDIPILKIIN